MAATRYQWIELKDFTGGRNAVDDPCSIDQNQVVEMRNGDTWRTHLMRKRGGATAPSIGSAFTGVIGSLISHFPSNNPALAELWGADDAATPVLGRMAGASTFSSITLKDNLSATTDSYKVRGASYGGKLFLAYKSAVDRLHAYDPNLSSPSARRTGVTTPGAAGSAAANTGSGSYAATKRYYRQRARIKNGSIVTAQSEPSVSESFTPSGSGTGVVITKFASLSESETHWVVEGSLDDAVYFELSETAVGTGTYTDTVVPAAYSLGTISAVTGSYTNWTSVKYVLAAFNRIFGLGSYASGGFQSRLWYSAAKGTSDKGDDERVPNTTSVRNFLDLDEGTGGDGTGLAGPIYGSIFLFKYNQTRKITPTGGSVTVFDVITLSNTRGAIDQECIDIGEDAQGRPCVFHLDSQVGPCITGPTPPIPIGDHAIRDSWDNVNLAATIRVGGVKDYPAKGQVWWWWATGSANEPTVLGIYTKATGGWSICDTGGKLRLARAMVLFARTLGSSMSRDRVPYTSYQSSNNTLLRGDTSDLDDSGTTFQALVKTRPIMLKEGQKFRATHPKLLAKVADGVTLTITADLDFGKSTQTATVDLSPAADEASSTRVFREIAIDLSGATSVQLQIGDAAAIAKTWTLERLWLPILQEDVNP